MHGLVAYSVYLSLSQATWFRIHSSTIIKKTDVLGRPLPHLFLSLGPPVVQVGKGRKMPGWYGMHFPLGHHLAHLTPDLPEAFYHLCYPSIQHDPFLLCSHMQLLLLPPRSLPLLLGTDKNCEMGIWC